MRGRKRVIRKGTSRTPLQAHFRISVMSLGVVRSDDRKYKLEIWIFIRNFLSLNSGTSLKNILRPLD